MSDVGFAFSLHQLWQVAGCQILLVLAALIVLFVDLAVLRNTSAKSRICILGWLTFLLLFAIFGHVTERDWGSAGGVLLGVFSLDKFTVFLIATIIFAGMLASLLSMAYMKQNELYRTGEYFSLLIFAVYGAVAMVQSVDLLMLFIALEVMSLSVYILAGFRKKDAFSMEGALKYFLLGSFGSAFYLFGMALTYGLTGSINLTHIAQVLSSGVFSQPAVFVAIAMIMAGLFFKMAFVPFHMWTPDVYEGSPTTVTGFMATAVKIAAFGAFIKVFTVAFSPILSLSGQPSLASTASLSTLLAYWKPVLWWVALLTMLFGNLIAVSQTNVKRMLAYSSIAHAGYMALGILAASGQGRAGVLFYLVAYTLMSLGAFGVIFIIDNKERGAQTLDDYRGLGFKYPFLAFMMSLFLVSMAGLPPTGGFVAKFYVFAAAIKQGYIFLAAMGILTSAIAAYYYLRVMYMMYMKDPVREVKPAALDVPATAAIILAGIGIIYIGIDPQWLVHLAEVAQKTLCFVF